MATRRTEPGAIQDLFIAQRLADQQPDPASLEFLRETTAALRALGRSALVRPLESMHVTYVVSADRLPSRSRTLTPNQVRDYSRRVMRPISTDTQVLSVDSIQPLAWVGEQGDQLALTLQDSEALTRLRGDVLCRAYNVLGDLPTLQPFQPHVTLGKVVIKDQVETDLNALLPMTSRPGTIALDQWIMEINRIDGLPERFR